LRIENTTGAATTYLLDETGRQHPVGILTSQAMDSSKPLLDEHYFIERAIAPYADIYRGNAQELIKTGVSIMIMTDANAGGDLDRDELSRWIDRGGTLIRFAGENLVKNNDPLTPVPVHEKPRNLIGNLAWSEPLGVGTIPETSPFAGLTVPSDIKIQKQLLPTPTPDLAEKSWVNLTDGTPFVTGQKMAKGNLVLFHVAASDAWSNLILSGFFVEMLQRLIWLSQGVIAASPDATLTVHEMLDGFGTLQAAPSYAKSIAADELQIKRANPFFPPGYYGSSGDKKAFNLSDHMPALESIAALPDDITIIGDSQKSETDLRPFLYLLTLLLVLIDSIISFNLRGLIPNWRGFGTSAMIAGFMIMAPMGLAAAEPANINAARHLRLAYVKTYSSDIDRISEAGLRGLSEILRARTAVNIENPTGLDIDHDELSFYPLLYWPTFTAAPPISPVAAGKINAYLKNGGMIVIDTRDGTGSAIEQNIIAQYFRYIDIPVLNPITKDHVLLRSFYLLKEWPGRWQDSTLWISSNDDSYFDGVSPIIVGTQDWASAWATDKSGKPLQSLTPGGEAQREYARRFGVNLVLYALTGNYKSDQVHVPAILERLNDGPKP
jgi:hypothetical protein